MVAVSAAVVSLQPPRFAAFIKPATWAGCLRASCPVAQLVRIPRRDDDDDDDDESDEMGTDAILQVSQVATPDGQVLPATGRSVASVQFMITRAMRLELRSLGYSREEVDRMEPPRARAIIDAGIASSKRPQKKPKTKRERFELQFTCNVCDGPNSHSISWHAYTKGTVLVTCPGCQASHLIADHLSWIEDDFRTLEQYMADRGTPVSRLVTDGAAAAAASAAASEIEERSEDYEEEAEENGVAPDPRRPWAGTKPALKPIAGINDEQAKRIKDAVRKRKTQSRRQQDDEDNEGGT